jgi:type I restriction enzyme S subunit
MTATPNNLPKGWEAVSLGDVTVPSTKKSEPSAFGDSKYLGLEHIEGGTNRIIGTGDVDSVKSTKAVFRAGDVLYGKLRPYLNKVCRPEFNGVCSTDILVYPQFAELDNGYLLHFLSHPSTTNFATQNASGINLPRVSAKVLSEIDFLLPPLPEQRRIVAKIEALQERSRKAREALAELGPLLEQFRQSLLAAAFRGDLTADWRKENPDVEPASELLERIRKERRAKWEQAELAKYEAKRKEPPKGWQEKYKEPEPVDDSELPELPEGWCWATIDELTETVTSGSRGWAKYYSEDGPLFLRVGNLDRNTVELDLSDTVHVQPPASAEGVRTRVREGDILVSVTADVGMIGLIPADIGEGYINQHIALLRPLPSVNCHAMAYSLTDPDGLQKYVQDIQYGMTKASLSLMQVRLLPVPVPPAEEQIEIVNQIERMLGGTNDVEDALADSQSDLTQLDQSILAKAFRGELVPQDPNDEPASVLLERIREAREAQQKKKSTTKSTKKRPAMRQNVGEKLKEWVSKADEKPFTFDDLRRDISGDYDELKDAVYAMLDQKTEVEQVFDESSGAMCFRRLVK